MHIDMEDAWVENDSCHLKPISDAVSIRWCYLMWLFIFLTNKYQNYFCTSAHDFLSCTTFRLRRQLTLNMNSYNRTKVRVQKFYFTKILTSKTFINWKNRNGRKSQCKLRPSKKNTVTYNFRDVGWTQSDFCWDNLIVFFTVEMSSHVLTFM